MNIVIILICRTEEGVGFCMNFVIILVYRILCCICVSVLSYISLSSYSLCSLTLVA